jgi:hypothetical protein
MRSRVCDACGTEPSTYNGHWHSVSECTRHWHPRAQGTRRKFRRSTNSASRHVHATHTAARHSHLPLSTKKHGEEGNIITTIIPTDRFTKKLFEAGVFFCFVLFEAAARHGTKRCVLSRPPNLRASSPFKVQSSLLNLKLASSLHLCKSGGPGFKPPSPPCAHPPTVTPPCQPPRRIDESHACSSPTTSPSCTGAGASPT